MSGLEGIAALGLACNILQLIGAVGSTIIVAKNILETGTIDPDLGKRTDELTTLFRDAEGSLSQTSQHKDDQELRVAAGQVLKTTSEFKSELAKISGGASKGKIRQVIGGTVKGVWRRQKLDKLEAEISRCRGMFESRLLLSLRHRLDLGALQQEEGFSRLDNSLQSFVKGLSDGNTKLEELINYQSATLMAHVTEESRQTRQEISTAVDTVVMKMNQEEKQRFLGSLRYDTMNERRNRVEAAHPGTYEWIFYGSEDPNEHSQGGNGDKYARRGPENGIADFIMSTSEKIYWISGKPGSGKSTLMKFMLENSRMRDLLNQVPPTGMSRIASHFIWAAGEPTQRSLKGTLSSLLFQLVDEDEWAFQCLFSKYPNKPQRLSLRDWSDQQLLEGLRTVCSCARSVICLIIDGLDEIDSADTEKILAIIDDLCTLTYVKCVVSSRPEHIFSRHFRKLEAPSLRMQDLTRLDIQGYVREKLRSWFHDPHRYRDVVWTLCNKAEGVFLWVVLAIKGQRLSADCEDDPEIVARRFEQLPSKLSELYSSMWDRLNENKAVYGEEGAKYLNTYLLAGDWGTSRMDLARMAFATRPALVQDSFKPSSISFLEHMDRMLEKVAVWIEVRTAGLIEVDPDDMEIWLVHRSALEFLKNDTKGLEITKLDSRTEEERELSLLIADLAVIKYDCDIDRLSRYNQSQHWYLSGRIRELVPVCERALGAYKDGKVAEAFYLQVLDQAASTYHAMRLVGKKWPVWHDEEYLLCISGDFFGFMACSGFVDYVSTKLQEHSTENKLSIRYLEYLWAETYYGIVNSYSTIGWRNRQATEMRMCQWLLNLLPHCYIPPLACLFGGYHRTATGLVCVRPLEMNVAVLNYEGIELLEEAFECLLQHPSPEHRALLKIPWYKQAKEDGDAHSSRWRSGMGDIWEHDQEFNVFIELPLKPHILMKLNDGDILSQSALMDEIVELRPTAFVIQSWISSSRSSEFVSVCPEKYFLLKTEEDIRFVTTSVIQKLAQIISGCQLGVEGNALSEFVNERIADDVFETISRSQFEGILVERGHAFKPSQESPWPPAMFEDMARPGVVEDSITEDDLMVPATTGSGPDCYLCSGRLEAFVGHLEGDFLRKIKY